jgi:oligoendopeptidase F
MYPMTFVSQTITPRPARWAVRAVTAVTAATLALHWVAAQAAKPSPAASSTPAAGVMRWDLSDIYATPEAWDTAYNAAKTRAEAVGGLQAGMGNNATSFLKTLVAISDVRREVSRLYTYSKLKGDEDLRFAPAQERNQRAQALAAMLDEKNLVGLTRDPGLGRRARQRLHRS